MLSEEVDGIMLSDKPPVVLGGNTLSKGVRKMLMYTKEYEGEWVGVTGDDTYVIYCPRDESMYGYNDNRDIGFFSGRFKRPTIYGVTGYKWEFEFPQEYKSDILYIVPCTMWRNMKEGHDTFVELYYYEYDFIHSVVLEDSHG